MCVKEVPVYYKLVLNTLCMTNFVTSSVITYSCGVGKISVQYNTIEIENLKKEKKDRD